MFKCIYLDIGVSCVRKGSDIPNEIRHVVLSRRFFKILQEGEKEVKVQGKVLWLARLKT